jgi:soluble lytic murein transglycosylase
LFAIFRALVVTLGCVASLITLARADNNTGKDANIDQSAAIAILGAARSGEWAQAYARAGQLQDPLPLKLVRWLDYIRSNGGYRFSDIAGFIDQNPDWPLHKRMLRRAEEGLGLQSDDVAADWLKRHPPISAGGKARAAELMISRGDTEAGTAALRTAWIKGDFATADEHRLLTRFSATFRSEDHAKRLDRLIWDGDADAARRMFPLVSADLRSLAEARLALAGDVANVEKMVAKVPAQLRSDPGLAFEEARWYRKKGNFDAAAQLLLGLSDNPVNPAAWGDERQEVARRLLVAGNADLAYRLVVQHQANEGAAYCDAEFLTGYIELRYRNEPASAFDHFVQIVDRATGTYGKARAAYWAGRAAETEGKKDLATKWYTAGAENMATFYGQLSAHQLGKDAPPHPVAEPRPDAAARAQFDSQELVRAAQLFFAAGDRDNAGRFLLQLTERAKTPLDFAMLASLAEAHDRYDLAIAVARRAIDAGMPLMLHGYPVTSLPSGGSTEPSLLFAIVRQESAFSQVATSRVGARGLMQLMPATAALVATKLQLPFSLDRLTSDGAYNLQLGRSYIERLIEDFGGSYPLAIAAYNAGPGRVKQWLHAFGDPRGRDIGMVDWIESIPFNETRTYVQRVLENLQVYRGQNVDNAAAFSLAADLAR